MKRKMIGLAIIISIALFACKREGPMGPEGVQGPDGPPGDNGTGTGGGGNNNVISFTVPENTDWQYGDGAENNYSVVGANFILPDSLAEAVETGMTLVYLRSVENDYYRLPLEIGVAGDDDHEMYDYIFSGNKLSIYGKIKNPPDSYIEPNYKLNTLKVIIGRATQTGVLELTD
jgi:hypothetical protein